MTDVIGYYYRKRGRASRLMQASMVVGANSSNGQSSCCIQLVVFEMGLVLPRLTKCQVRLWVHLLCAWSHTYDPNVLLMTRPETTHKATIKIQQLISFHLFVCASLLPSRQ